MEYWLDVWKEWLKDCNWVDNSVMTWVEKLESK